MAEPKQKTTQTKHVKDDLEDIDFWMSIKTQQEDTQSNSDDRLDLD